MLDFSKKLIAILQREVANIGNYKLEIRKEAIQLALHAPKGSKVEKRLRALPAQETNYKMDFVRAEDRLLIKIWFIHSN